MGADRVVRARAFAKINLSLRVLGVRADGYHELRTVFQSLALHDTLTFRTTSGPARLISDEAACPADSTNLVWRAAQRVWAAAGRPGAPRDLAIRIAKRIPVEAGLGGGSSDAAAAIRALASLWRVKLAPDRQREIAAALGADVPYFFEGGTALGVERGDELYPLIDADPAWVVLAVPQFGTSTKDAFEWWNKDSLAGLADPSNPRRVPAGRSTIHPYADGGNDLQAPVAARHPQVARLVEALRRMDASHAAMSGSGSAVFGLFDRRAGAESAARRLAGRGRTILVTQTLGRMRYRLLTRPVLAG